MTDFFQSLILWEMVVVPTYSQPTRRIFKALSPGVVRCPSR